MAERVIIEAGHSAKNYWKDLWKSKELLLILSRRDLAVRYKQTMIGAGWAVIRPLLTMFVMVFVFKFVGKFKGDPGIPYPLMVLSGIMIWTFFSTTFTQISHSLLINSNLLTKTYFPRLIMPLSSVIVGFVDFLITLVVYIIIATIYRHYPNWQLFFLPIFIILALLASLAFGLLFAVVNIRFRDIGQLIPFLVQIGFYICPIAYSSTLVTQDYAGTWLHKIYYLNPLVSIIDGFKWCLLGENASFSLYHLCISTGVIATVLVSALYFFRKQENSFVDYI